MSSDQLKTISIKLRRDKFSFNHFSKNLFSIIYIYNILSHNHFIIILNLLTQWFYKKDI
jgi:hypothetical protein